ncbi:hypothetical protein [Pseudomonas syringae group genomosp. 3]|uniref:hypothetical protein n=1 Tax=Pseudomonas syringae group genomosp. 3 TaxID=251701 RepID=UPI0021586F17|nr:hypothetical protein [Pseudomonas syringae group genomosp. 3]
MANGKTPGSNTGKGGGIFQEQGPPGSNAAKRKTALMHRNFKMPMHQADAMTEASCLQSDA